MINWKVRAKNKAFWLMFIPLVLLLIEQVCGLFGLKVDFGSLGNQLKDIVETVFLGMGLLGIVNDPTTAGLGDSQQALTYAAPKKDAEIQEE